MTFSIVAFDESTGDLGIAVASRFLAVGAVVPWARAGVGAVATQAMANTFQGPRGLDLLKQGLEPHEVIARVLAEDEPPDEVVGRQLGIVDARGRAASHTGPACQPWAGGGILEHVAAQGNILTGAAVVDAMLEAYPRAEGDLADRLLTALRAGQAAGGDRRGQQSAALLVVRERGGFRARNDRYIDVRVDDHPAPIDELARLVRLWRVTFFQPSLAS